MSDADWRHALAGQLGVLRIVVVAMAAGCLTFAIIVAFATGLAFGPAGPITYIAIAAAAGAVVVRFVVLRLIDAAARRAVLELGEAPPQSPRPQRPSAESLVATGEAGLLYARYATRVVAGTAILEGVTLLLLISFVVDHSPYSLALAGLLIVGILLQFPTLGRVIGWIETQLALLADERSLRG